jgi:NADPH:quinone reductase-like Zn-dependent oxidoreductase
LLAWVERSGLRPVVDSAYSLDGVHAALDRLASGEQFGKVAITIDSP